MGWRKRRCGGRKSRVWVRLPLANPDSPFDYAQAKLGGISTSAFLVVTFFSPVAKETLPATSLRFVLRRGFDTFGLVLPRGEFLDTSPSASETQLTYILIRVMGIGRGNAPGPG